MKGMLICSFVILISHLKAQDSIKNISYTGYVESFYAFDFNQPSNNQRPHFLYSHNRQNEFNVNLAYIKAAFSDKKTRANIALGTGTYMIDNYSNEPSILKNILEANVGINLTNKIGLDVGIMPSHIGFESAISKDCWTLTRSLLAENSPYFETGAKLSYNHNDKWSLAFFVLNGWQRISRINSTPSVGSQIFFKPSEKLSLNWSTFYGSDRPDSLRQMRFFNNFYTIYQATEKWGFITGCDIGSEQVAKGSTQRNIWYTPILIVRFKMMDKWALAGRFENFTDKKGVIITNDFQINGYSVNLDYTPLSNALIRIEARFLDSKNDLFATKSALQDKRFYITSSLSIGF